jgi:hypothetical protein
MCIIIHQKEKFVFFLLSSKWNRKSIHLYLTKLSNSIWSYHFISNICFFYKFLLIHINSIKNKINLILSDHVVSFYCSFYLSSIYPSSIYTRVLCLAETTGMMKRPVMVLLQLSIKMIIQNRIEWKFIFLVVFLINLRYISFVLEMLGEIKVGMWWVGSFRTGIRRGSKLEKRTVVLYRNFSWLLSFTIIELEASRTNMFHNLQIFVEHLKVYQMKREWTRSVEYF